MNYPPSTKFSLETYNCYIGYSVIMSETTTIQVKRSTRDALRSIGHMGEDYNTVIEGLIREHNRNELAEYSRKVVAERKDEFVSIDDR